MQCFKCAIQTSQLNPLRLKKLFWVNASILRQLQSIYRKLMSQLNELWCQNVQRSENFDCCSCYHMHNNTSQKSPMFVLLKHGRLGLNIFKGIIPCGESETYYRTTSSTFWKQCIIWKKKMLSVTDAVW